jgi:hypothetical protein
MCRCTSPWLGIGVGPPENVHWLSALFADVDETKDTCDDDHVTTCEVGVG